MAPRIKSQAKNSQAEKEYRSKLKQLVKTGLYIPKQEKLTPHTKKQINKIYAANKSNLDTSKTLFIKIPKSEKFRSVGILRKAKGLKLDTSSTGIFIPKNGQRRGTVIYNYKTREAEIKLTGKVKWGKNVGKRIETRLPLVSIDKIGQLENNFLNHAAHFGKLGKDERIYFRVIEDGRGHGVSKESFTKPEQLINYLRHRYDKSPIDRVLFYRHIVIEKATYQSHNKIRKDLRERAQGNKRRKVNKTGRNS
jgi:hypothetical protein